jgi:cholesterol 7-dehydrogenase
VSKETSLIVVVKMEWAAALGASLLPHVSKVADASLQIVVDCIDRPPSWDTVVTYMVAHWYCGLALVVGAYLLYRIGFMLWAPYVEIVDEHHGEPKSKMPRELGDVPPVLPNGWFRVCLSRQLMKGQVLPFTLCNRNLAIYRDYEGQVGVLDAYCPHMGANLAVLGEVSKENNTLRCPFHGWEFGKDGKCKRIPYSCATIPSTAETKGWLCKEIDEMVLVWYDAEGREPYWSPEGRKEFGKGGYRYHGHLVHEVRAHISELPENGPDVAHLNILHKNFIIACLRPLGFGHRWSANWYVHEDAGKEHLARIELSQAMTFWGRDIPGTKIDATIDQCGPALVYLHLRSGAGDSLVIQSVTPVGPLLQSVMHTLHAPWYIPRFVAKFMIWGLKQQFERDHPVWANKMYLRAPLLVKGDGPIMQFRRWYSKFYSKSSPTVQSEKEKVLSW